MHRLITGSAPALDDWLAADLSARFAAAGAPARVVLLSGAGLAGKRMADRLLAAGIPESRLWRMTLSGLAGRLAPDLPPLLPADGDDALLRRVAGSLPPGHLLAAPLHRPGLRRAVLRAIEELRSSGFADVAEAAGALAAAARGGERVNGPLLTAIAGLLPPYQTALAASGRSDLPGRLAAACAALAARARPPGPVYLHGMLDLNGLERRLVRALAAHGPLTVLLPHDGTPACRWLEEPRAFFHALGCQETALPSDAGPLALVAVRAGWAADAPPPPEPGLAAAGVVTIVAAPGPAREVREAVRAARQELRAGVPPSEVAILFRDGHTYRQLVHETLTAAGIHHYLPGGLPLITTPAGRALAQLLALAGPQRRRAEVLDLLLTAPLRWSNLIGAGSEPVPEAWDRLSRQAGITGGAAQWHDRLAALRAELAAPPVDDEETGSGRHAARADDLARLDMLVRLVKALFALLDGLNVPCSWVEGVERLLETAATLIDDGALAPLLPPLHDLLELEGMEPDNDPAALHAAVLRRLAAIETPVGNFQEGVFAGDLTNARGLSFHTVILLGVVEHGFPAPLPPDPILDESTRRAVNRAAVALPGAPALPEYRPGHEELLFHQVLTAARERLVLLYPYQEADGRERYPSFLLLRAAEALAGHPVDAAALPRLPCARRISPARLAPDDPTEAITALEYDLAEVQRALDGATSAGRLGYLDRLSPDFARAREAMAARTSGRFGAHGGVFAGAAARDRLVTAHTLAGRTLSVTDIETYARCPRRYYFSRLLRLEAQEEPAEERHLRPDRRGVLIHTILQRFYEERQATAELPLQPAREAQDRHRLLAIAADCFAAAEQAGHTGAPLIWEMERAAIEEDLVEWLSAEIADATDSGLTPAQFELAFGTGNGRPPVTITVDGRPYRFRARIDRLDRSVDGRRLRVVDYKTGRVREERDGKLRGGRSMQLPVYLHAALALAPQAEGSAQYAYVTRTGAFTRVGFDVPTLQQRAADIARVVRTVAEGVAAGRFFPWAGRRPDACASCDFTVICGAGVKEETARCMADPDAAGLLALEEIA